MFRAVNASPPTPLRAPADQVKAVAAIGARLGAATLRVQARSKALQDHPVRQALATEGREAVDTTRQLREAQRKGSTAAVMALQAKLERQRQAARTMLVAMVPTLDQSRKGGGDMWKRVEKKILLKLAMQGKVEFGALVLKDPSSPQPMPTGI